MMSATMFVGRVLLPATVVVVAVSMTWQSMWEMAVRTEVTQPGAATLQAAAVPGRIIAEGRVVAYPGAEVTIGTEVLGTIVSMPACQRGVVRKGELLLELRSDDVRASLREAHFRLIEAEAGLRLMRARIQLDKVLPSFGGRTPASVDDRLDEHAAALARRDAAKAAVDRLEAEAVKYRICAPISGVITSRQVDPGETVTPGSALLTIVDLTRMRVEAELDEFDIAGVAPSASATITAEGYNGRRWRGQVEEIADAVVLRQTPPDDPSRPADTRVLRVEVAFRESHPLRLGQHVEVEIVRAE
jgi:HlyD family secretion protein